ncbi:MAG: ATP-binding protein, partial [Clostridia bacterium]|nr:ATP-binding protein [Clostridia bacterium]
IRCIVILSLAGVASIAYIVYMIVEDVELGDTVDAVVDFFEEHAWVAVSFIIPLGGIIWGAVTSNWILILLVLGGFIAFISIALLAHLIKYVFENFIFGFSNDSNRRDESDVEDEMLNAEFEDVEDCVDDRNKLETFTVAALKEYCRKHNIRGYYKLNKSKIINLIVSSSKVDSADSGNYEVQKNSNLNLSDSRITFEDIAGLEEAKTAFREKVVFALEHKDLYEKYGKKVGGGLLLYGLPGTGKTMFAEAASNETNALFIPIKCSDIKSKWYGESENNVKEIFAKARKTKKAIIFFDEFEAIGAKRTDNSDNVNNDLVPQILAEMQGIGTNNSDNIIIVIAATNKPWAIDSAFMRPGRFDDKIYIPLPDFAARKRLFELKLNGIPQENLDYEYLAKISDGFNGADVGAFCEKLKMIAIKQSIALNNEYLITMEDIKTVEGKIMSSVSKEDIERLIEFSKR